MSLPLPNLDDRRWTDLVEEGRALIPLYAPDWTDHNVSDPGITFAELLAWLAEMDLYQLNRVTDRHRRKFLALVGIQPRPPAPARAIAWFALKPPAAPLLLPEGVEVEGKDPFQLSTRFRTLADLTVVASTLENLLSGGAQGFSELAQLWNQGRPLEPFGNDPKPGTAFYIGLDQSPPAGTPVSFHFSFTGEKASGEERLRIEVEQQSIEECCRASDPLTVCDPRRQIPRPVPSRGTPPHHSARTAWEFYSGEGRWQRLDPARGEVMDDTRSFTLDGAVRIKLPAPMAPKKLGHDPRELFYLRCVFVAGAYDAAPELADVVVNAIAVEQAVMPDQLQTIRDGDRTWEVEALGTGRGVPGRQFSTSSRPVVQSSFELFTIEGGTLRHWSRRNDFDASKPDDCHFLLDPALGTVNFGDGDKGRVPPDGAQVLAAYLTTRAEAGNLEADKITSLTDSPRNRALLTRPADPNYPTWESVRDQLAPIDKKAAIGNAAASGGMAAETLSNAEARAMELIGASTRAVTLADYEQLAAATPGTQLARVAAKANTHPAFPCLKAPGMISVLILPSLPAKKPMPGGGLLRVVTSYLRSRRIIGTRVEVFGPTYVEVVVRARVRASRKADAAALPQRIIDALNAYFDPLTGGPDKAGWPFGRDVFRAEILALIARIDGVDYVVSLELAVGTDGAPQCNNICLGPDGLVLSGKHQIEVLR